MRYAAESRLIRAASGGELVDIAHIGSMSVPAPGEPGHAQVPGLWTPKRLFFGKGRGTRELHNLHVVIAGSTG